MNVISPRPLGRLLLVVRDPCQKVVAARRARNIVLRQGAAIIARLFSGAAGSSPINQIQVGFARETASTETTALTAPADAAIAPAALLSPVKAEDIKIITDKPGAIQVQVASLFKPTVELKDVTEAGLLAGETLYNQVVFEPVTLRPGQDVTFFWEIDFPFGH